VSKNETYWTQTSIGNEKQTMFLLSSVADDPDPDPLVRGMDPRIRIHTKISWIRNTAIKGNFFYCFPQTRKVFFLKKGQQDPKFLKEK
jgi:hypothetical protein